MTSTRPISISVPTMGLRMPPETIAPCELGAGFLVNRSMLILSTPLITMKPSITIRDRTTITAQARNMPKNSASLVLRFNCRPP